MRRFALGAFVLASVLLWLLVVITRSRLCPHDLAWLAEPSWIELALLVQLSLLCLALPVAAWRARSSLEDDHALFCSWGAVSGLNLLLLVFAVAAPFGHEKRDDLFGYFIAFGGGPLVVVAGFRWLGSHGPETARAVVNGLALVLAAEVVVAWVGTPRPAMLFAFLALACIAAGLALGSSRVARALNEGYLAPTARAVLVALPATLIVFGATFHPACRERLATWVRNSTSFYIGATIGLGIATGAVVRSRVEEEVAPEAPGWRIGAVALVVLCAAAMLDVNLGVDTIHYGAYLGPANAVLHGRVPLVQAHCQYGLEYLIYTAAFGTFLPRSYAGAAFVTSTLSVALYLTVLLGLRRMIRSWLLSIAAGVLCVLFFQNIIAVNLNCTPSSSGFRFFPLHLLLLTLLGVSDGRSFTRASVAATVLCALWSLESLLFGVACHAFFLAARGLLAGETWRALARRLGKVAAMGAVPHALLTLVLRAVAGEWPHYQDTLGMARAHIDQLSWIALLDPLNLSWIPVVLIYLVASADFVRRVFETRERPSSASAAAADARFFVVAALGIMELSIFAARAHWSLLTRVAFPFFTMVLILLDRALRSSEQRRPAILAAFAALPLLGGVTFAAIPPDVGPLSRNDGVGWALVSDPARVGRAFRRVGKPGLGSDEQDLVYSFLHPEPVRERLLHEGFAALDRWAHDQREVLVFTPQDTPLLFLSGRVHRFPISNPVNDGLPTSLTERILSAPVALKAGEPVFVAKDLEQLFPLQKKLLLRILRDWNLRPLETGEALAVYRLETKSADAPIDEAWRRALAEPP